MHHPTSVTDIGLALTASAIEVRGGDTIMFTGKKENHLSRWVHSIKTRFKRGGIDKSKSEVGEEWGPSILTVTKQVTEPTTAQKEFNKVQEKWQTRRTMIGDVIRDANLQFLSANDAFTILDRLVSFNGGLKSIERWGNVTLCLMDQAAYNATSRSNDELREQILAQDQEIESLEEEIALLEHEIMENDETVVKAQAVLDNRTHLNFNTVIDCGGKSASQIYSEYAKHVRSDGVPITGRGGD